MDDFNVTNEQHMIEHRPYSDCYKIRRFAFNREITADEFQNFLTGKGFKLTPTKKTAKWHESYVEISGSGREWEYKTVKPFLD